MLGAWGLVLQLQWAGGLVLQLLLGLKALRVGVVGGVLVWVLVRLPRVPGLGGAVGLGMAHAARAVCRFDGLAQ